MPERPEAVLERLPKLNPDLFTERAYPGLRVYDCFRRIPKGCEVPVFETADILYLNSKGGRDGEYRGRVLGRVGNKIVVADPAINEIVTLRPTRQEDVQIGGEIYVAEYKRVA